MRARRSGEFSSGPNRSRSTEQRTAGSAPGGQAGAFPSIRLRILQRIRDCSGPSWDRCAAPQVLAGGRPGNPFLAHRFLAALEDSGSVGPGTGWSPLHVVAEDDTGSVVAVMPLYLKSHSRGEYVFDDGWATAFMRAGGRYYPKLQSAVPFTPVSGPRILVAPGTEEWRRAISSAMLDGVVRVVSDLDVSSIHISFCTRAEWELGAARGWLCREALQLHWTNRAYETFEDFLSTFSSRKRKQVRRERRLARESSLRMETLEGDAIRTEHWDAVWSFYQDTGSRNWGTPYLTREFFDRVHAGLRGDVVLFLASDGAHPVAGALNFRGSDALFGRYWGCVRDVPFLHFELCYYRAVEYAIANGLARVEAGAGGGHKIARGYTPAPTYSLHWIVHEGLSEAVRRYLELEREEVQRHAGEIADAASYRRGGEEP